MRSMMKPATVAKPTIIMPLHNRPWIAWPNAWAPSTSPTSTRTTAPITVMIASTVSAVFTPNSHHGYSSGPTTWCGPAPKRAATASGCPISRSTASSSASVRGRPSSASRSSMRLIRASRSSAITSSRPAAGNCAATAFRYFSVRVMPRPPLPD
nr:hypothetical protein [Brevundimonas denitrificans]